MYEAHFKLKRKPFASYPEPDMMYWGEGHKMARTMLVYGLTATNGIVVITGEIGSGKTTLLNHLLTQDRSGHILGRLNGAAGLSNDVAAWVLYGFGMNSQGVPTTESLDRVRMFLTQAHAKRRKAVLFIDEAQLIPDEGIEDLRLLSDMQIKGKPVLQLVLLGQPELARKLNQPALLQFRQRIVSHYHLKAFTAEETENYVRSRLTMAGGDPSIVTEEALDSIHAHTEGVPRRINILCDTAFVYAYAQGQKRITKAMLDKVVDDRSSHGLLEIN
jgi:type II secretory pathway predicted ATPase ExeA